MTNLNNTPQTEEARQADKKAKAEEKRLRKQQRDAAKLAAQQAASAEAPATEQGVEAAPATEAPHSQGKPQRRHHNDAKVKAELLAKLNAHTTVWHELEAEAVENPDLAGQLADLHPLYEAAEMFARKGQYFLAFEKLAKGMAELGIYPLNKDEATKVNEAYNSAQDKVAEIEAEWGGFAPSGQISQTLKEAKEDLDVAASDANPYRIRMDAANRAFGLAKRAGWLSGKARRDAEAEEEAAMVADMFSRGGAQVTSKRWGRGHRKQVVAEEGRSSRQHNNRKKNRGGRGAAERAAVEAALKRTVEQAA